MKIQSAHFLPGANKQLGEKYLLLECLGDGSHGWVWRSERLIDNAIVAVKIPKQLSKDDRSLSEGKELIGIGSHPNVINIYDMGRVPPEKEWFAIEMEYFPSESLAQKLESRSSHFGNTYERLFKIYTQVLDAVDYLSNLEKPISHGDIKPHNILVGQDDLVKLTDFGSSALPEEIYVRTRENGGTVLYAAPEYSDCVSRKGSFLELLAGDVYSLGVLLYQLTTGRLPHDTQSQVRSHAPFPKPREINSGICVELENVILTCLEKEPANRYASISELIDVFEKARNVQNKQTSITPLIKEGEHVSDWSTDVINALEKEQYQKAATIAAREYSHSGDTNALLQQLNSLLRDDRLFDFDSALKKESEVLLRKGDDEKEIRLLSIKAYLKMRNLSKADEIIKTCAEYNETTFEHRLCEASISGMKAEFDLARNQLESLNKEYPMKPQILTRLVQVCEQQRDYEHAAGFLRVSLKILQEDERLMKKRQQYEALGVW